MNHGRATLLVCFLWAALPSGVVAQSVDDCPIPSGEEGIPQLREFTDSTGKTTQFQFAVPMGHDRSIPSPVMVYFHGNNSDDDGMFEPNVGQIYFEAEPRGIPSVAVKSIGTRTNSDGSVVRAFSEDDDLLLRELFASNFGGCVAIDRKQLYLVGESEGTCLLSIMLTKWMGYEYGGGILGLCGCWRWGEHEWVIDPVALRANWKLFIENTTDDFLHLRGLIGFDDFHYNLGMDVRTDLMRPGGHCADSTENMTAAMDWMLGLADYPIEFEDEPHWQQVDVHDNLRSAITYDATGKRFLVAVNRPDLTPEQFATIDEMRILAGKDEAETFEAWLAANYPQFANPTLFLLATPDYGNSFETLAMLPEQVNDVLVTSRSDILLATSTGLLRADSTGTSFAPFAFGGMDVELVLEDASGRLYVTGPEFLQIQRSLDGGGSWTGLNADARGLGASSRNELRLQDGRLMAHGFDEVLRFSDDGGDTWVERTVPGNFILDLAHHGDYVYGIVDNGMRVVVSSDMGMNWEDAPPPASGPNTLGVAPDGTLWINEFMNVQWRSDDHGQTLVREPGLHNVRTMDIAYGEGAQRMVVATRGILRHSDAVPAGTWPPGVDAGSGIPGPDGGISQIPDGGALPSVDGGVQLPVPVDRGDAGESPAEDGCTCHAVGGSRPRPALAFASLVIFAIMVSRRRRRRAPRLASAS